MLHVFKSKENAELFHAFFYSPLKTKKISKKLTKSTLSSMLAPTLTC